jgi:hypothetical protein
MSNQVSRAMNDDESWLDPEDSNNQMWVIRGVIGFILLALILALYGAPYSNPIVREDRPLSNQNENYFCFSCRRACLDQ